MRIQLRRQLVGLQTWWRLVESDGELVSRWLPNEGPSESLDQGGFECFRDAQGFALAIDWMRAQAGLLGDLAVEDIDRERAALDDDARGRPRSMFPKELPWFEAA